MTVSWDASLIDIGFMSDSASVPAALRGLAINAIKITTGALAATVGVWAPGAIVQNAVDGTNYQMIGSTASPVWAILDTGAGFTLPASITDSTTTTGTSFAMIMSALTTGIGEIITAASATTAIITKRVASALTTGIIYQAVAAIATLTTGRYFSANDGATEVWGIGANGHIHSTASASAPSAAITAAHGITAVALTTGATDVCGQITSTGTQDNTTDSTFTLTFGKTYTVAPKSVQLFALNAAGAVGSSLPYVVSISATAVVFGVSKSAAAAATPSWCYQVIA